MRWIVALLLALGAPALRADPDALAAAAAAQREGRHQDAIRTLRRAMLRRPRDAQLRTAMASARQRYAISLLGRERPREAIPQLRAALALRDHPELRHWLGLAYFRDRSFRAAAVELRLTLAAQPERAEAWRVLGFCYYHREQLDGARRCWERARSLSRQPNPDDARWLAKLAREAAIERDFRRQLTDHFRLLLPAGPQAEAAIATLSRDLEMAFTHLSDRFGHRLAGRVSAIVYPPEAFAQVGGARWVGGLYDGKIRLPARLVDQPPEERARVIRHELAHVIVLAITRRAPGWLNEGIAQLSEPGPQEALQAEVARLAAADAWLPLDKLAGPFAQLPRRELKIAYPQSWSLVRHLHAQGGDRNLVALLRAIGDGKAPDEAVKLVYGAPLGTQLTRWKARARSAE